MLEKGFSNYYVTTSTIDKNLKSIFNTNKFSKQDINKFILLLWKGVYSYEYVDNWEKFSKTSLLEKESFYSHLNKEYTTDADYMHAKGIGKDIKIKMFQRILWFVC